MIQANIDASKSIGIRRRIELIELENDIKESLQGVSYCEIEKLAMHLREKGYSKRNESIADTILNDLFKHLYDLGKMYAVDKNHDAYGFCMLMQEYIAEKVKYYNVEIK
jgi:hypothetical protein